MVRRDDGDDVVAGRELGAGLVVSWELGAASFHRKALL